MKKSNGSPTGRAGCRAMLAALLSLVVLAGPFAGPAPAWEWNGPPVEEIPDRIDPPYMFARGDLEVKRVHATVDGNQIRIEMDVKNVGTRDIDRIHISAKVTFRDADANAVRSIPPVILGTRTNVTFPADQLMTRVSAASLLRSGIV